MIDDDGMYCGLFNVEILWFYFEKAERLAVLSREAPVICFYQLFLPKVEYALDLKNIY